jgi:acyl dehydratase
MRRFDTIESLAAAKGEELGASSWMTMTQDRVNEFAEATEDHQWIHVDVERAASGPFGHTIAHGYLTLSLIPFLSSQVFSLDVPGPKLNYGLNSVRFPTPVPVGSHIRCVSTLMDLEETDHGHRLTFRHEVEVKLPDGVKMPKPACVAETIVLLTA